METRKRSGGKKKKHIALCPKESLLHLPCKNKLTNLVTFKNHCLLHNILEIKF